MCRKRDSFRNGHLIDLKLCRNFSSSRFIERIVSYLNFLYRADVHYTSQRPRAYYQTSARTALSRERSRNFADRLLNFLRNERVVFECKTHVSNTRNCRSPWRTPSGCNRFPAEIPFTPTHTHTHTHTRRTEMAQQNSQLIFRLYHLRLVYLEFYQLLQRFDSFIRSLSLSLPLLSRVRRIYHRLY